MSASYRAGRKDWIEARLSVRRLLPVCRMQKLERPFPLIVKLETGAGADNSNSPVTIPSRAVVLPNTLISEDWLAGLKSRIPRSEFSIG